MNKTKLMNGIFVISLLVFSTNALAINQEVKLSIENMTCKMCDITVRKAIEKVGGVAKAIVDYESKTAQVIFNPDKTTIKAIEDASTMSGYPAKVKSE